MDKRLDCPCKRVNCERHGNCKACRENHHASEQRPLTACEQLNKKRMVNRLEEVSKCYGHDRETL